MPLRRARCESAPFALPGCDFLALAISAQVVMTNTVGLGPAVRMAADVQLRLARRQPHGCAATTSIVQRSSPAPATGTFAAERRCAHDDDDLNA